MDKSATEGYLLKALTIGVNITIISFFAAVITSIGWTYILTGFWDWNYLICLCVFYGINISLTVLLKKWYEHYLQRKNPAQIS